MKYSQFVMFFFIVIFNTQAGVITLTGIYQGQNLFVQNPILEAGEFCVISVYLNDKKVIASPKSSTFEIDLSKFENFEPVEIKIVHKNECTPSVLNPQVLKSKSKFSFSKINITEQYISWETRGEEAGGKFELQHLITNNWVVIYEIEGKGSLSINSYSLDSDHHSGLNTYRIKFTEASGEVFYSQTYTHKSETAIVSFYPKRVTDLLYFVSSKPVMYLIYNKEGLLVKSGKAKFVDCKDLKSDEVYTVVFDNQRKTFLKKGAGKK